MKTTGKYTKMKMKKFYKINADSIHYNKTENKTI